MQIGDSGQPVAPGVRHIKLGSLGCGVLDVGRDHGMGLGHVAADDENQFGLAEVLNGIGHGARPEGHGQPCHRGGVAGPSAVVDVVGSDDRPKELLHLIGILVDAAGAAHASDGVRTVFGDDFPEPLHHQVEGFIPGCFAEMVVFPNEGRLEPLLRVDEVISIATLDAETTIIGLCAFDTAHLDDAAVPDMKRLLASGATVRTGRSNVPLPP